MGTISRFPGSQVRFGMNIGQKSVARLKQVGRRVRQQAQGTLGRNAGAAMVMAGFMGGLESAHQAYKLSEQTATCFQTLDSNSKLLVLWRKQKEKEVEAEKLRREKLLKKNPSHADQSQETQPFSPPSAIFEVFKYNFGNNCVAQAAKNEPKKQYWWTGALGSGGFLLLGLAGLLTGNRGGTGGSSGSGVPMSVSSLQGQEFAEVKPTGKESENSTVENQEDVQFAYGRVYKKDPKTGHYLDFEGNDVWAGDPRKRQQSKPS